MLMNLLCYTLTHTHTHKQSLAEGSVARPICDIFNREDFHQDIHDTTVITRISRRAKYDIREPRRILELHETKIYSVILIDVVTNLRSLRTKQKPERSRKKQAKVKKKPGRSEKKTGRSRKKSEPSEKKPGRSKKKRRHQQKKNQSQKYRLKTTPIEACTQRNKNEKKHKRNKWNCVIILHIEAMMRACTLCVRVCERKSASAVSLRVLLLKHIAAV